MKRIISVLLVFVLAFAMFGCSGNSTSSEQETSDIPENSLPPILGVHIVNGDTAGFYALTKSGTYSWAKEFDENGEASLVEVSDGPFCLDMDNICSFNREDAGESIDLKFTGEVESYKIYAAETSVFADKEKSEIISEEYLVVSTDPSKIVFPESGEYYYVVDVKYKQGDISYGFILEE